ncbi:Uncharacterised protein [Legionella beliardensis]|uniref:Transmembrane protein n=1 Tax=Legionella beliardensis TaxID=91822 RepID=A0A378I1H6_9GAMM|nr:hypothetical protein [Legionella beliardensis]STX28999.1 Uncharacterised protein [Legionella beliardensis]
MLILATIVFAIAAALGIYLINYIFQDKNTPKGIVMIHGAFAALGIVLLILYFFSSQSSPVVSLILFILAALGGFYMVWRDVTLKPVPKFFVVGHGLIAVIAFICLIVFQFTAS